MTTLQTAPDYLNPGVPAGLRQVTIPIVEANDASLAGYGYLIEDRDHTIEIVRWPAQGWRPVDPDTGDEGGVTEGLFEFEWRGDILYGRNNAVGGHYLMGWSKDPGEASPDSTDAPTQVLLWHANYHPDGGQLFFPLDGTPFLVPLALPGDDVRPEHFVAFWCDGTRGLYIHPNIWHEGVFPIRAGRFFDRQGKVHARVSVDFAREFQCLLRVPFERP
ncbi:MAG: ureidoglycolate lyase [Geminicoccaceae bacterium]